MSKQYLYNKISYIVFIENNGMKTINKVTKEGTIVAKKTHKKLESQSQLAKE